MPDNALADLIRTKRIALGLSQIKLGMLCGYKETSARHTVQRWESGEGEPSVYVLRKLAAALQLPLEDLIP